MISIRHNPILGIAIIIFFALLAVINFAFATSGTAIINIVTNLFFIAIGIFMLKNPVLVVVPGEVQVKNLIGMICKRYPFNSFADLKIEDSKLYVIQNGLFKKVNTLGSFLRNSSDWNVLVDYIQQKQRAGE